ncbi:DUF4238 domain-containing protein [Haladaptatus sp. DYF46]|uniref:DUF4238 domain-containing protein n=1 Tax=Haladaptatus sp. DYF46 TaxID=2886041 RepID=UPI001E49D17D|nr:DUF4238 domain-containing protein [Haladaptatus sp. DYF46]
MVKEKKKQHFVPRFYLNTFSRDEEDPYYLHCYDKPEDKIFPSNTKKIAQREYFYDLSDKQFVENKFADFEGHFSQAYYSLLDSADVNSLTSDERKTISLFLSHLHIRTQKFREIVRQASEHTLETVDADVEDDPGREAVGAGTTDRGAKEWQLQLMANALEDFAEVLEGMNWFLFVNETEYPLWTSDHPIAIFNTVNPNPVSERGVKNRGTRIHVPLSADLLLGMYDPKEYFFPLEQSELTEKGHVEYQNRLQVEHSHRQVYSPVEDFEFAKDLIKENPGYAEIDYDFPDPD